MSRKEQFDKFQIGDVVYLRSQVVAVCEVVRLTGAVHWPTGWSVCGKTIEECHGGAQYHMTLSDGRDMYRQPITSVATDEDMATLMEALKHRKWTVSATASTVEDAAKMGGDVGEKARE